MTDEMVRRYRRSGHWGDETFSAILTRRAAAHPEREALVDRRRRVTYAELAARVDRVAAKLGALALARAVAALGFRGLYVDANAVAPDTAREIGRVMEAAGARFVDGGIIGPATRTRGTTRIYLAGPAAPEIALLFGAGPIDAIVLDAPNGAASALKIAFAGWNKGSQALLAAIRAFALAEGVDAALLAEWKISMPDTIARSERAFRDNARKAWRFVGEMEEIARSLAGAGLPPGFHEAAREIYERLADYKDATKPPPLEEAAAKLLRPR